MKNIKTKVVLGILTIAVFGFIFKDSIIDIIFTEEIEGCTDPLGGNYDSRATVDDGSCTEETFLSEELLAKINALSMADWNQDDYVNLRDEILMYFNSINEKGSNQESISLKKLDLAYMYVLNIATDKSVDNCFKSYKNLKNEVTSFYKKYKGSSSDIKTAKSWFDKRSQVYSYKSKVKNLLKEEYDQKKWDNLNNKIVAFKNSSSYRNKLKKCSKLSSVIRDCDSDLQDFSFVPSQYERFKKRDKRGADKVGNSYFRKFKPYDWYLQKIILEDSILRSEKQKK